MIDDLTKIDSRRLTQDELDRAVGQQGTELGKGARSATLGMRSSLRNAMGAASEGLGYNNYAQENYAAADELGKRAADAAPRVGRLRDVNSVGDFGDWAAGTLGALAPSAAVGIGAGLVSGGAAVPAMLAGTATYAPLEIGEAIGRQREAGQPVDGLRATMGGLASAAGQSIVPGIISAKLAGKTAGAAATAPARSLRTSIGAGGAEGMALEGVSEAGGEYAKQLGSTQTLDTLDHGAALDAAAAGALGGGVMGGLGGAAEYAHRNAGRAGQGLSGAIDATAGFLAGRGPTPDDPQGSPGVLGRVRGAFGTGKDAAVQQVDALAGTPLGRATDNIVTQAGEALDGYGLPDKLSRVFKSALDKTNEGLDQVASSQDIFGDTVKFGKDMAAAGKEGLVDLFARNDGERFKAVKKWADNLAKDNLSPEQYSTLSKAMGDLGDRANQATVASMRAARNGFNTAKTHATDFINSVERWNNDRKFKRVDDVNFKDVVDMPPSGKKPLQIKRSEMDAGLRQRLNDELVPVLQQLRPEIFDGSPDSAKVLRGVGDGMRKLALGIAEGRGIDKQTMADLLQFTSGNPEPLIQAAYRAIDRGDKKQAANVLRSVEVLDKAKRAHESLQQTLTKLVVPERQRDVTPATMRDVAAGLEQWVERAQTKPDDPSFKLKDREVRQQLTAYFGKNVDAVLAAVEQNRKHVENVLAGEQADEQSLSSDDAMPDADATDGTLDPNDQNAGMSEKDGESFDQIIYMGRGKTPDGETVNGIELFPRPPDTPDPNSKYPHKTSQAIARAQARVDADGKGMAVQWRPASELGFDHPKIKPRYDAKVELLMNELQISRKEAEDATKEAFKDLGAITAEGGKQETRLSKDQIASVLFDKKYNDNGARIDTGLKGLDGNAGEISLDAVRLTNLMEGRSQGADNRSQFDDKGARHRKARMFMEGIAAVMDHLGGTFDIPDSAILEKPRPHDPQFSPMTWGDAKKLMAATRGSESSAVIREGEAALAEALRQANIAFAKKDAARPYRKDGEQIYFKKGSADAKELGALKSAQMKTKNALERLQDKAAEAEMWEVLNDAAQADNSAIASVRTIREAMKDPNLDPRTVEKLDAYLSTRTDRDAVTEDEQLKGRLQKDPFGNVHRTLGGAGQARANSEGDIYGVTSGSKDAVIRTDSSGLPRAEGGGSVGDGGRSGARFADAAQLKRITRDPRARDRVIRSASKRQELVIGEAAAKLREAFGPQLEGTAFVVQEGEGIPAGSHLSDHDAIALRADILRHEDPAPGVTALQRLTRVMAHELAHAVDRDSGYESQTAKGLQPGGKAYEEARAVTEPRLKGMYAKIFDGARDNAKNARELFAQLNALYHSHPELMREHQPIAYAAIERQTNERAAAYRAAQTQSVSDGRGAARRTSQPTAPGSAGMARRPDGLSTRIGTEPIGRMPTEGFTQGTAGAQGEFDMDGASAETAPLDIENAEALLPKGKRPPPGRGPGEGATKGSTPSPKAVAAKKAALQQAASSGDPALLKELSTSTDAKGLQRAIDALAGRPDAEAAYHAALDRLGELMRADDSVAYGMLLPKKYSLLSTQIHEATGNLGFAATHDSPHKFDGKFDWRTHQGKGEGLDKFGAGTYLSTADSVHSFYKNQFTAKVDQKAATRVLQIEGHLKNARRELRLISEAGKAGVQQRIELLEKELAGIRKSPTYEVSVDIPPNRLLNWNKPLKDQPPTIKLRALKLAKELNLGAITIQGDEMLNTSGLDMTGEELYSALSDALGSQAAASERLQATGIQGHTYASSAGKDASNPNYVIYDDSKITTNYVHFSKAQAASGTQSTQAQRQEVDDFFARVAPWVERAFYTHIIDPKTGLKTPMLHAGEFERVEDINGLIRDVVRLSAFHNSPLSPGHHEAMHAFFAKLTDLKAGNVMDVLERAGKSASVMNQLKRLLANEPEALKQLENAEERAAYMYQFWAAGQLKVGPETRNVLQRIADFIRSVLGIWSNDERALHILEYFHKGEFATDMTGPVPSDVVQRKLMDPHTNKALTMARRMFSPMLELGEALASAGGERLRSTGIPALRELADAMKLHGTDEGTDPGFVPAARREHMQRMNALAAALKGTTEEAMAAALQSLQTKSNGAITALATPEGRLAARKAKDAIRQHLDDTFGYMRAAGVKVDDLGYGKDYFPRVYDAAFISAHQAEFNAVLARHGVSNPQNVTNKIMVTGGNEFTVEVDKPGMQHVKMRKLAHIPDAELAPFMVKDPMAILNNYTSQAARRAEWARRFNDDGYGVTELLSKAKEQGATPQQMETAQNFVRAVDGTLGDTIDPAARRMMGNMIVYQNIRLLPLAIFSSVVDPMGVMVRGGTVSDAWKTFTRGVKEAVKPFKKTATDDDMTQLAQTIGVIEDSALMHTMSALYMQGMAGDTARKINDTFFRYNLMEQWNTSVRVGAMQAAMSFLKRHNSGTASKHSQRWLNELGLQPGEVVLDAQGNVDARDPKMAAAINRWVDGAVLRPDATDSAIWMSDPHFALIAHMKKFVFAFHETILKRVAHEYMNGNFAPVMAMGGYVPIMIAADLMKGLIQGGGDEPEWKKGWTAGDYLWHGVERAGLLGTGQFAVDAMQGGVGQLSGPTLEQLGGAVQVATGRGDMGSFILKSMPANALYAEAFRGEPAESTYVE